MDWEQVVLVMALSIGLVTVILGIRRWRRSVLNRICAADALSPKDKFDLELTVNTAVATLIGGVGLIIGVLLTSTQILDARRSASAQLVTDRATKGFELLKAESTPLRVGGVYLLYDVAQREPLYTKPIYEALVDHIRSYSKNHPPCLGEFPPNCRNGGAADSSAQRCASVGHPALRAARIVGIRQRYGQADRNACARS